jgi:hypothetical protein
MARFALSGAVAPAVALVMSVAALAAPAPPAWAAPAKDHSAGVPPVPGTHRAPAGGCVVDGSFGSYPSGSAALVVRPHPVAVDALWLPGLNARVCSATRTRGGVPLARRLAADITQAPQLPAGHAYACPLDDGTAVDLTFDDGSGPAQVVHVALGGCRWLTSPFATARELTPAVARDLLALAPAPWRGYVG